MQDAYFLHPAWRRISPWGQETHGSSEYTVSDKAEVCIKHIEHLIDSIFIRICICLRYRNALDNIR
ncbi:predicted protein [Botrytis cinerea T4]|uniref:Uncharacterized protein n=1 Tax=Botryotinia fuckeliana (strain T4) TaxID=999810 RepID=G2YPU6_BOTF4|nr:predicted protein [Botrytis cinerea T4]